MRFFTPELYMMFNSPDDEEADLADEAWEAAIERYRRHLDHLHDRMPSPVRRLADSCLHDAELLASDQAVEPFFPYPLEPSSPVPSWSAVAIVSVRQDEEIVSLLYSLWDRLREHEPREEWPFSTSRPHWLYDEIDVPPDSRGTFLHRILLSDGRVLEVPFVSVMIHRLPLPPREESDDARQSA